MAYVAQQRLDGYAEAVTHALKRQAVFDKRELSQKPGEVVFSKGQLVQIYRSDLDYTFKTERKLLPKWSPPQRATTRNLNSYTLENLDGTPITGRFSARRLRAFIPHEGTKLSREQAAVEEHSGEVEETHLKDEEQQIMDRREAELATKDNDVGDEDPEEGENDDEEGEV